MKHFSKVFVNAVFTETALLKVLNDILISCDSGDFAVLVLLDLTAAFDRVDHAILIDRLEHCIGLRGIALDLLNRILQIEVFQSRWVNITWGGSPGFYFCSFALFSLYAPYWLDF